MIKIRFHHYIRIGLVIATIELCIRIFNNNKYVINDSVSEYSELCPSFGNSKDRFILTSKLRSTPIVKKTLELPHD